VGWIAIALLAAAVLVILGAEWPRLSEHVGGGWSERKRRKRKRGLTVIEGEGDSDDFAKSVERDLANLPVIGGESDDRSRR
jgi:hypothetical protein